MNFIKKALSLAVLCLSWCGLAAQSDDVREKIYEIKMDEDNYLYTEVTLPSDDSAVSQALESLRKSAASYAAQKGVKSVDWNSVEPEWKILTTIRGDHTRAFAYISYAELDKLISGSAAAAKPEPKPASAAKPEPAKKPAQTTVWPKESKYRTEVLRRLLQTTTLERAMACLNTFSKEGKIAEFGPVNELEGKTSDYILVIYDRTLDVVAFLSDGDNRINLKSELPEELSSYKGCAAIGVRIN